MKIQTYWDALRMEYIATDADSYDGCSDGNNAMGQGDTEQDAIDDLMDQLIIGG